jgi:hypothetical protein
MAEILGLGVSHYPPLSGLDEDMANAHRGRLNDPDIPATAKDPHTWSELAQREWADPVAAAASHRAAMRTGMSRVRQALDDFDPDFVLIWGDDQYENFKEDIVPAFSVLAYEDEWGCGRCCTPSSTPPMPGVKDASESGELLLRWESMLATYR